MHIIFQLLWIFQQWQNSDLCQKYSIWQDHLMTDTVLLVSKTHFGSISTQGCMLFSVQIRSCWWKVTDDDDPRRWWSEKRGQASSRVLHISDVFDLYTLILDKHREVAVMWDFQDPQHLLQACLFYDAIHTVLYAMLCIQQVDGTVVNVR